MPPRPYRRAVITRRAGSLALVWHATEMPPQDEWNDGLQVLGPPGEVGPLKLLVLTEGGAPSPLQQAQFARAVAGRTITIAIVSDSIGVRFVVSSLALLVKSIRSFRLAELSSACAHLQLDESQVRAAFAFVSEVGLTPPAT